LYQWGSLDFHRASLANLAEAMARTRKLCAIMLDTSGRVRLFSPLSFLSFSSFSSSFSEAEKGSGGCEKRLDLPYSFLSSLSPLAD
jgi:hypothetical protein